MSQEHVWYCRKPDRGIPKQSAELTAGNQELQGEVCIKRGIFQGDSLSPLLFILALILLTLVLRKVKAGYNLGNGLPTIIHLLFSFSFFISMISQPVLMDLNLYYLLMTLVYFLNTVTWI